MAGYDNLIFGRSVPGWGTDGILEGDERLAPSTVITAGEKAIVKKDKVTGDEKIVHVFEDAVYNIDI
jgi:hypothetical protein